MKLAAMKGQIKLEVIQDVQAELDKSKGSAIKRLFTFDRDTDIGRIQIGDRCMPLFQVMLYVHQKVKNVKRE